MSEQPTVQYATTSDGVSIAYSVMGSGSPLVYLQPYSHQHLDWLQPEMRDWYSALAEQHTLIRYDTRHMGLSQRGEHHTGVDSFLKDLQAVVDRVGIDQFDLFGVSGLGFAATTYAAANPQRVSRLVLWGTPAKGSVFKTAPRQLSLEAILKFDEELAFELLTRYVFGDSVELTAERLGHAQEAVSTHDLDAYLGALFEADISAELKRVECPTLVMFPRTSSYISSEAAQAVAALLRDCSFVQVEAGYYPYQAVEQSRCTALVEDFLEADSSAAREPPGHGLQTILFTDIEASTSMTQRLGDEEAQELLRAHNATVREALTQHRGHEVKHTGDGIMAAFQSAVSAVDAAVQIQRDLAGGDLRVRIGLNAGEPISEDGDFFGTAVQLAARVTDRAEPGEILVSRVVADLCAGRRFTFESLGNVTLKGFDHPLELSRVQTL